MTSPSITLSICPLMPDTVTSFCSDSTTCPANLTKNKSKTSSKCPYKNLIKVGASICSFSCSVFRSYHSLRKGLPMLDIRNPFLGLSTGVAQCLRASSMSRPNCSYISSGMSIASSSLRTSISSYISCTRVSKVLFFFVILDFLKCFYNVRRKKLL